jgi:hypothetical protein
MKHAFDADSFSDSATEKLNATGMWDRRFEPTLMD